MRFRRPKYAADGHFVVRFFPFGCSRANANRGWFAFTLDGHRSNEVMMSSESDPTSLFTFLYTDVGDGHTRSNAPFVLLGGRLFLLDRPRDGCRMLVLLLLLPRCKTDDVSVAMKKKQSFWETLVSSGDTPSQGFACRRPITLQYIAACCCRRHVADCGANLSTAPLFTRAHSMCGTSSAARP